MNTPDSRASVTTVPENNPEVIPMRRTASVFILILAFILSCTPKYRIDHAKPSRPLDLPKDDAAHFTAQTEWWYYTGHLRGDDGIEYGFEVTFFKRLTSEDRAPWFLFCVPGHWVKEVGLMGHFAITDPEQKKFKADQILNLFHKSNADPDRLHVFINGWSVEGKDGSHLVKASMPGYAVDLKLTPAKPAALHGPLGIVEKGVAANYYYSYTSMNAEGTLTVKGKQKAVRGRAWMDHEFGPMELVKSQIGWDWFSIQLDNNTELMIYLIKSEGHVVAQSGGSFVDTDGTVRWLKLGDLDIKVLSTWTSPSTKAEYPAEWDITIKPLKITLHVKPVMAEQELTLKPVTYWEGAVLVEGTRADTTVTGKGYVELVGYDKKASFGSFK
jgi:predicted secreted hydrolase